MAGGSRADGSKIDPSRASPNRVSGRSGFADVVPACGHSGADLLGDPHDAAFCLLRRVHSELSVLAITRRRR